MWIPLHWQEQGVAADLWAPAGCTASSQPEPAAAGRSVWSPSPPDPAPAGWTRSVQTAPAAERREREKKKEHRHYNKYSQTMRMWSPCLIPSQNKDVCLCNKNEDITSGLESSSSESMGHPVRNLQYNRITLIKSNAHKFATLGLSLIFTTPTSNLTY